MKIKRLLKLNLMRAAMTLALILACATAWAGTVTVNIIGSGTVNVTYNGTTTEENINSGWNMSLSGSLTLIMIPAQGYTLQELQMVTNLGSSIESTIENNGVYTYTIENVSFYNITYTVVFSIPGVTTYTLTGDGMTFSVEGQTVTSAEEGQRVDITLPSPGNHSYWIVTSSDVAIQKDDANHFHFTMPAKSVIVNAQQYYQTAYYVNDESTHGHVMVNGNNAGTEIHYADETITLTPVADAGYEYLPGTLTATNINTNESINLTDNGDGTWSFTMPNSQVSVSATFSFDPAHITMSGNEYTIHTATGWNVFCDLLEGGESFSGKTVKLGANISITQSAGSAGHEFMGTFDGDGKTLTVNITETTTQGTAPFREINSATIQNLVVTGSVVGTTHAAGLVGFARGADASTVNTITNCKVATNVTVTTPNSAGNYHCGGVVGHAFHCTLNMSNTVYCGDITNSGNNYVGGLQGWSDGNTINFSHCLFVGSYSGTASFHPVAVRNNNNATTADVSHVYYTVTPTLTSSNFIAADGTKATGRTTAPDNLGSQGTTYSFMNMTLYENGLFYNGLYYVAPTLNTDNSGAYLISSVDDWTNFCDMLYDNTTWNRFSGQIVKLGANIEVSRMAGANSHDFCGTFDGQNNTLTFTATATDNYLAPFRNVSGTSETNHAVIQNLNVVTNITATDFRHAAGLIAAMYNHVDVANCNVTANITATKGTNNPNDLYPAGLVSQVANGSQLTVSGCTVSGTISTDGKYAGGMVGIVQGSASITNSVSSVTINSSTDGDGTHGGFVASLVSGRQLTIEGCVFNGKIVTTNGTTNCGGFLGHNNTNGGTGATITNCLYAPTTDPNTVSTGCATFGRNVSSDLISNCYYTTALGDAQGTQAYSISGGNYVTVGNAGTASSEYNTSGLSFYNVGFSCGNVLYAAENDVVSLTLGNTVPEGYFLGYSASPTEATLSGSGNPYTLTMPDADVVITANTNFPSVSYVDENGETQQCTDYIWLIGTETTLGAAGQETWCVVHSTLDYSQGIQLLGNTHIILCDGAAMNIGTIDNPVSGSSFQERVGFYGDGNNLSLYAQSGNTGALTIYSQSCSFFVKDLTIAGGNVNTTSLSSVPVIFCDNLTVRRSSLEVYANYYAAIQANNDVNLSNVTANLNSPNGSGLVCSNFAVDHSQLTVNARYQAIQANVITLGCTAATDFIKATCTSSLTDSYYGTVKIADGQTLYAGTNAYTGTLTDAQRQAIGGQKLTNVAPPTYDYIDLDGTGATHTAVVINADNMPTALSGWYIVQGTVNYTNTINLASDTHIILADNAVMNVTVGGNHGIRSTSGNNYSLFVYGQTGQSGELNVTSNDYACYIYGGDITIAGGKVTASGTMGIYAQHNNNNNGGNVTIKNATVTATGTSHYGIFAEYGGNITIDNSNVTATSTGSYGIYAMEGNITITDCEVEAIGGSGIYAYSGNNSGDVGNVTIQNATVTATASFAAIRSNYGNITIDNSNVTATSTGNHGIYAENGNITIASGTVTASSTKFGIYTVNGSVTINGGQVTTTGNLGIYTVNGSVTINGGQVSAIGNTYGIYAQNSSDNITLGWTNPTDCIYANKYYAGGTLSIAEGKAFIDEDGQTYSGTIAMVSGAYAIDGKTLYPYIEGSVPYIDENGQRQLCTDYNVLNGTETTLGTSDQETWYVTDGTLDYSQTITLSGNVHLILKDNAVMNVGTEETPVNGNGIYSEGHSISIYAQSMGESQGQLHLNANADDEVHQYVGIIALYSSITINGGKVSASGYNGIFGVNAPININGGQVTVDGSGWGIYGGDNNININGGQVTANGGTYGIQADGGNITLGWTNVTDFIYANSYDNRYYSTNITLSKAFIDEDGNTYSGTVAKVSGAYAINGKWLYPNTVSRFTKTIVAHHTEEGVNYGWYLIASPLSGGTNAEAVAHLVNSETPANFDLYRFNQAAELEWENWKQQNSDHYHFNLEPGRGYLYANAADVNLVFAGTPYSGNGEVTITNVAGHPLSGWNLVGNPFAVNAILSQPYYRMNAEGTALKTETETTAVAAMEGVFVQANEDSQTVTFTAQTRGGEQAAIAQANIMVGGDNGAVIDNAIIRFDGGQTLEKFSFREGSTKIYIPQDGTDYAIVSVGRDGVHTVSTMPLNFKASENGTYTLTVSTTLNSQLSTLNYLHLIDNMTGADVDLLALRQAQGPASYTFTAKTTDYESRFKLVFSICEDANGDNEAFAFISNGNLIVKGEGTLQIFDILGHQLFTKQLSILNSQLSTLNYTPGVYVLRLIDGEKVRTQKIVVE